MRLQTQLPEAEFGRAKVRHNIALLYTIFDMHSTTPACKHHLLYHYIRTPTFAAACMFLINLHALPQQQC